MNFLSPVVQSQRYKKNYVFSHTVYTGSNFIFWKHSKMMFFTFFDGLKMTPLKFKEKKKFLCFKA